MGTWKSRRMQAARAMFSGGQKHQIIMSPTPISGDTSIKLSRVSWFSTSWWCLGFVFPPCFLFMASRCDLTRQEKINVSSCFIFILVIILILLISPLLF